MGTNVEYKKLEVGARYVLLTSTGIIFGEVIEIDGDMAKIAQFTIDYPGKLVMDRIRTGEYTKLYDIDAMWLGGLIKANRHQLEKSLNRSQYGRIL